MTDPQLVLMPVERVGAPTLDDAQQAVLAAGDRAQLVLGPAGSGKTTLLLAALADATAADESAVLGIVPDLATARRWRTRLVEWTGRPAPRITTVYAHALQLVQQDAELRGLEPPRLLSAADQLRMIADVLAASRPASWPVLYQDALATRRFAERVRDFIGQAARSGWAPDGLAEAGRVEAGRPQAGRTEVGRADAWPAIAEVWRRYRRVLALSGAVDYGELLDRAAALAAVGSGPALRLLCVEDYADLDPGQLALLRAMPGEGTRVLAAADPDQVADRFRGASEDAVSGFASIFPGAARPVLLTGSHRFGSAVEDARLGVAVGLPLAGLPAAAVRQARTARVAARRTTLDVITYPDGFAEGAGVAGLLRRLATAHLAEDPVPRWRDAAVLMRTAEQVAAMEQALSTAGIPVAAASNNRLMDEPVVALLATALQLSCRAAGVGVSAPDPGRVVELALAPICGADPVQLRQLLTALQRTALTEANPLSRQPGAVLAEALIDPGSLLALDPDRYPAVRAVERLQARLQQAARQIEQGEDAAAVLWTLWSENPRGPGRWASRLRAAALGGGAEATIAHRALDAVLALFAEARRSPARGGRIQAGELLAALPSQPWPGGSQAATSGQIRNAVAVLTAHRARGLQWPLTVVAGVQEGTWPSEAGGLGLLGEELLQPGGSARTARESHIAAERRLFSLACTRASEHLVVTAVAAGSWDPGGPQPSRFLADLGVPARAAAPESSRAATPVDMVARARLLHGSQSQPQQMASAAARLAGLVGDPDFPWADPGRWWGLADRSRAPEPMLTADEPAVLSVTALSELADCPRRWFLNRILHATRPGEAATGVGRLVHRIHEGWVTGEIERSMIAAEDVLDRVWSSIPFDADWYSRRRRSEVRDALRRLLAWQESTADRLEFAERQFAVEAVLADGSAVRLRGTADVGMRNSDGSIAVLDLKTAKSAPTRAEVARHVQLAGYQWAVQQGGLGDPDDQADAAELAEGSADGATEPAGGIDPTVVTEPGVAGEPSGAAESAGAALLMAAIPDRAGSDHPKVLWQPPLAEADPAQRWFEETLSGAVAGLRAEDFPATPSGSCRTCPVRQLCPARSPSHEVTL